jgi:phosphoribosylaminoimidazole-succinocarboxamide synthase
MKIIYEGKTKRLIRVDDRLLLQFKDAITGDAAGNVDPGGDFVVGQLEGKGVASARVAAHLFKLLSDAGINTHFRRLHSNTEIEISSASRIQLEVVYRSRAYGSFLRRYRGHVEPMAELDIVEFSLKDDALGDPLMESSAIIKLGIASPTEVEHMRITARKVARVVAKELAGRGLELIDLKVEFGRVDEKLVVVDELSGDTMRVYDPTKKRLLNQIELAEKLGVT